MILTRNDSNLRCVVTQRETYAIEPQEYLSAEIEFSLARVLEREIQLIDQLLDAASDFQTLDFNVYQAFRVIDYLNSNCIDENRYHHIYKIV